MARSDSGCERAWRSGKASYLMVANISSCATVRRRYWEQPLGNDIAGPAREGGTAQAQGARQMGRLTMIDPARATGETKELLDAVKAKMGAIPNLTKALANSPAALRVYLDVSSALAGGKLDGAMRERIALGTAEYNACTYCLSAHAFVAKHVVRLDPHEIAAARRFESHDERIAAVLAF